MALAACPPVTSCVGPFEQRRTQRVPGGATQVLTDPADLTPDHPVAILGWFEGRGASSISGGSEFNGTGIVFA